SRSFMSKVMTPPTIYTLSLHDALPIYSSWPEMRNPLRPSSALASACVSMSVLYVTSYPERSSHRMKLISHLWKLPNPESAFGRRSEEHTSELQSPCNLVCRLLLEKKKQ